LGGLVNARVGEPPRLSETTPHSKVRFLAWAKTATTYQAPTHSRLGSEIVPRSKQELSAWARVRVWTWSASASLV